MVHAISQLRRDQDFVFQINTFCMLSYYVWYVLQMLKLKTFAATLSYIYRGLAPASNWDHAATRSLLPPQWDGEDNGKKIVKLMGWDEDSLKGK